MTTPLIPIPLPYNLMHDELNLDPGSIDDPRSVAQTLRELSDGLYDDEEVERILRAAVVLYQSVPRRYTFAQCLDTAIIWERG